MANDADVRLTAPKAPNPDHTPEEGTDGSSPRFHPGEKRLPMPGSIVTRQYKGETLQVKVLERGFEYQGQLYKSLSAVAKAITGSHCNGYLFFRLGREASR